MFVLIAILPPTLLMSYFIWQQWQIFKSAQLLIEHGIEIQGLISKIKVRFYNYRNSYRAVVKFNYFGKEIMADDQMEFYDNIYEVGQQVSILVNGNNSSEIWIKGQSPNTVKKSLYVLLGLYLFSVTVILILFKLNDIF